MNDRVEEVNDENDDRSQQHIQGHIYSLLAGWIATGSRCRVRLDHAFRKEYKAGKQAVESDQK